MKVVYAHTDSIYVPIESVEKAKDICTILNNHMREHFPNLLGLENHPVTLEFEKYYEGLGVGVKKNRNAGYISWKDGKYLDEHQFVVTGFSTKRISENKIGKEFQSDLLKMWAGQKTKYDIVEFCKQRYNDVKQGRVTLEDIVKRGRVRRPLEEYKSIAGGIAGVCYYNRFINPDDPIDDSFFYIECKFINGPNRITLPNGTERPAKYISVKEMKEFNENFEIDWGAYAQKSIVQKAKPIFLAMGWDMKEFIVDENQQSLGKWL